MSCSAKVIADSVAWHGRRPTTFVLRYGRAFHAEVMTHAEFARNASSSRAIPWSRMRQAVLDDPWIPIHWGREKKGMQMDCDSLDPEECRAAWLKARDDAVANADKLAAMGLHKSAVNRVIEPWSHITLVISGTRWGNLFNLRLHRAALPDFQQLAKRMAEAYLASKPRLCETGQWHLPFVTEQERADLSAITAAKVSVARCARTSYRTHDGRESTVEEDVALFERLMSEQPVHASPAGHQAWAHDDKDHRSGNFLGWTQLRQTIPNHYTPDFDVSERLAEYGDNDFLV